MHLIYDHRVVANAGRRVERRVEKYRRCDKAKRAQLGTTANLASQTAVYRKSGKNVSALPSAFFIKFSSGTCALKKSTGFVLRGENGRHAEKA